LEIAIPIINLGIEIENIYVNRNMEIIIIVNPNDNLNIYHSTVSINDIIDSKSKYVKLKINFYSK
jgi:hypothetical protein